MEDAWIVELFWQRREEAVAEAREKYGSYCQAIAFRLLDSREDAEECVNDTWLRAWNAMPENRPERLGPFLGKITRSLAVDRFRREQAEKRGGGTLAAALEELGECVPAGPSAAQAVEDAELERAVNRFLRRLPERACGVFLRRYWYGETLAEIGERYGMGVNTVKTSLFRSRRKLRAYLEKEGYDL